MCIFVECTERTILLQFEPFLKYALFNVVTVLMINYISKCSIATFTILRKKYIIYTIYLFKNI